MCDQKQSWEGSTLIDTQGTMKSGCVHSREQEDQMSVGGQQGSGAFLFTRWQQLASTTQANNWRDTPVDI